MAPQLCAVCPRPAKIVCDRCRSEEQITHYCSKLCQMNDAHLHKPVCNELAKRKFILESAHRAGIIAQTFFYTWTMNMWAHDMKEIRVFRDAEENLVGAEIIKGVGTGGHLKGDLSCHSHTGGWLFSIPSELRSKEKQDVLEALMTDRSSAWAFVVTHLAIKLLFKHLVKNVDTDIKEVTHTLNPNVRRLIIYSTAQGDATNARTDQVFEDDDDVHSVYEINLKSGVKIALNLTGAQFNEYDGPNRCNINRVARWEDYWLMFGSKIIQRSPCKTAYNAYFQLLRNLDFCSPLSIYSEILQKIPLLLCKGKEMFGAELEHMPMQSRDPEFYALRNRIHFESEAIIKSFTRQLQDGETPIMGFPAGLYHPTFVPAESPLFGDTRKCLMYDSGSLKDFNWDALYAVVADKDSDWSVKEDAKRTLMCRSAYKPYGDWRIVFLKHNLPPKYPGAEWVSINPYSVDLYR